MGNGNLRAIYKKGGGVSEIFHLFSYLAAVLL